MAWQRRQLGRAVEIGHARGSSADAQETVHPHPGRLRLHEGARRGVLTPHRATTLPTTLVKTQSLSARDPHSTSRIAVRPPMMADGRQLSIVMTAALSAEFDGRVPADLVADLVRAVLDESRRFAHDRGVESSIAEARQRLERFIRARSSVQQPKPGNQNKPVTSRTAWRSADSTDTGGGESVDRDASVSLWTRRATDLVPGAGKRLEVLVELRHAMLVSRLPGGRADARPDAGYPQPVEHEVGVEEPVLGERADGLSPVEKTWHENVVCGRGFGVEAVRPHGMHGVTRGEPLSSPRGRRGARPRPGQTRLTT
jgi:hypothetical protein